MKKILFLAFLLISVFAEAQMIDGRNYTTVAAPTRWNHGYFSKGLMIPNDTVSSTFPAIAVKGTKLFYNRGAGPWQEVMSGTAIIDSFVYATRARLQKVNDSSTAALIALIGTKADASHLHPISDVTGLTTALSGKINASDTASMLSPYYRSATATAALAGKENTITAGTTSQYWRGDKTFQTLDKAAVGLANVDNTSDLNKPVSTATQTALNGKENSITAGTTLQYWRGDKSFQTLNTTAVPEGTNLYYTDTRARAAISLTTTGSSGAATYTTGVLNIPNYTAAGLGAVPTTRTITINGTALDLSANRSWTVGDVLTTGSYSNPAWISALAWSKITGAPSFLTQGYQTIQANGTGVTQRSILNFGSEFTTADNGVSTRTDVSISSINWSKIASTPTTLSGYGITDATSNARAAISLTNTGSSGASTYNSTTGALNVPNYTAAGLGAVPTTRTITINGTALDLSADRSWSVGTPVDTTSISTRAYAQKIVNDSSKVLRALIGTGRSVQSFTSTASQTTFTVSGGYSVGQIDVFFNGSRLSASEFTASNGTSVVLATGAPVGTVVDIVKYGGGSPGGSSDVVNIDVAARYGVVADGVTDNVTALMQMRADLVANNKYQYNLYFPSGTVLYSNNRWTFGIKHFTIIGGPDMTTFRNIYSGADEKFQRPFFNGDMWQENTMTYTGGITYTNAHRFNTAAAGATSIFLTTIADATVYSANKRILIYGFDQVGEGFPPGTRYNEWNEILSVNNATGEIVLKYPLKYRYDATWWDLPSAYGGGSGKPRILLLERANYVHPYYAGFKNVVFGKPQGGGASASGTCSPTAENAYLENCIVEGYFWPSCVKTMECKNVRIVGDPAYFSAEIDKIGGYCKIQDSYFSMPVTNGGGFEQIEFENCYFNETVWLSPKKVSYKNCTIRHSNNSIYGLMSNVPAKSPIDEFKMENITFLKGASSTADVAVAIESYNSLTVAAVSGNKILIPFGTYTDANALTAYTLEVGFPMFKTDGTKTGLITNVTFDPTYNAGQGAFEISGTWNVAPVVGEVWAWSVLKDFVDLGGHQNVAKIRPLFAPASYFRAGNKNKEIVKTAILTTDALRIGGGEIQTAIYGKILSIETNVVKPYNGTDATAQLYFTDNSYANILSLNTRVAGRRVMTEFAAQGTRSGDTQDITKLGIWQQNVRLFYRGPGMASLVDQSEAALPVLEIKITYTN